MKVWSQGNVIPVQTREVYRTIAGTPALMNFGTVRRWSASRPCHFTLGDRAPDIRWRGGFVGPPASLDVLEKTKISCPCWDSGTPHRPARRLLSLYWLSYPPCDVKILWNVLLISTNNESTTNIAKKVHVTKFSLSEHMDLSWCTIINAFGTVT
jgi:hypothetical protein